MERGTNGDVTDEHASFDHYARLVCSVLRVPTSTVTIVEAHRQVFPGAAGLQEPYRSTRETPLSRSYCRYVVADERPLVVPDARLDPRLADNPAVHDGAIAYAGWPLTDGGGRTVGSLCAVDNEPRQWTVDEVHVLKDLAVVCSTELQHTGRVAKEGESLARAIFDAVDIAMAFYDPEGELLVGNELAQRLAAAAGHRLDRPPYAGPHVRRADNTTPVPPAEQVVPRALRGEEFERELQWAGAPDDGIAFLASSRPVLRSDGRPWGTLVAGHDVTGLAHALEDLEDATRAAESANEAKSVFLATISHELRTPLTSLLAAREMLEDTDPAPSQVRLLSTMERAGDRLQALIESLLEFARIAAGEIEIVQDAVDPATVVAHVLGSFEAAAMKRGLTLCSDVDARVPALVVADPDRLRQVLSNLVDNAVKFTEGGEVTVLASVEDVGSSTSGLPHLLLTVRDTGPGMHPDHHASVFEPFTQIDPSMTRQHEGSGLGLATCQQLVTLMGGDISLESAPGTGCTFTVRLPLRTP